MGEAQKSKASFVKSHLAYYVGLIVVIFLPSCFAYKSNVQLRLPASDLLIYRSAEELFITGMDPYSDSHMAEIQTKYGNKEFPPHRIWNPPVLFVTIAPWLLLPVSLLGIFWPAVSTACSLFMARIGWSFGSRASLPPLAFLYFGGLIFTSFPWWAEITIGQIASILGLVITAGFYLLFIEYDFIAGFALGFAFIKPHLLFLPMLLGMVWVLKAKRWKVILGMLTNIACFSAVAEWLHPGITSSWINMPASPGAVLGSSLSSLTRLIANEFQLGDPKWAIWAIPLLVSCALIKFRPQCWKKPCVHELAFAYTISPIIAPYGFVFDQVILIVPKAYLLARAAQKSPEELRITFCIIACLNLCALSLWTVPAWNIIPSWYLSWALFFLFWCFVENKKDVAQPGFSPVHID